MCEIIETIERVQAMFSGKSVRLLHEVKSKDGQPRKESFYLHVPDTGLTGDGPTIEEAASELLEKAGAQASGQ